ncbi:hypothetical protein D9M73_233540 [compost metagenome]
MRSDCTVTSCGMPKVVNVDRNRSSPYGVFTRVSSRGVAVVIWHGLAGAGKSRKRAASAGLPAASLEARCQAAARISGALAK